MPIDEEAIRDALCLAAAEHLLVELPTLPQATREIQRTLIDAVRWKLDPPGREDREWFGRWFAGVTTGHLIRIGRGANAVTRDARRIRRIEHAVAEATVEHLAMYGGMLDALAAAEHRELKDTVRAAVEAMHDSQIDLAEPRRRGFANRARVVGLCIVAAGWLAFALGLVSWLLAVAWTVLTPVVLWWEVGVFDPYDHP